MVEVLATRGTDWSFVDRGIRPPDQGPFQRRVALTFDEGPDVASTPLPRRRGDGIAPQSVADDARRAGRPADGDAPRAVETG